MIHPRIFLHVCLYTGAVQIGWTLICLAFLTHPTAFVVRLIVAGAGGYVYGLCYGGSASPCAVGGMLAGGLSLIPAILLAALTGGEPGSMVPIATGAAMLAGGAGGASGSWAAAFRRKT